MRMMLVIHKSHTNPKWPITSTAVRRRENSSNQLYIKLRDLDIRTRTKIKTIRDVIKCMRQHHFGFIILTTETQILLWSLESRQNVYLLESAERSQDRATNPDTVLSLGWSNHLDLHAAWGQSSDFLAHSVSNAREHGRTTTEDYVSIQVLPDINITLHN